MGRSGLCVDERRSVMLYAAIDIHKHAFQAAVLDPETGEVVEKRVSADRDSLARCAEEWRGRVGAVAIEATTCWCCERLAASRAPTRSAAGVVPACGDVPAATRRPE